MADIAFNTIAVDEIRTDAFAPVYILEDAYHFLDNHGLCVCNMSVGVKDNTRDITDSRS